LYKKRGSATSVLSYLGHVLSDTRHGLVAAACWMEATTLGERQAAVEMTQQLPVRRRRIQVAAIKPTMKPVSYNGCDSYAPPLP